MKYHFFTVLPLLCIFTGCAIGPSSEERLEERKIFVQSLANDGYLDPFPCNTYQHNNSHQMKSPDWDFDKNSVICKHPDLRALNRKIGLGLTDIKLKSGTESGSNDSGVHWGTLYTVNDLSASVWKGCSKKNYIKLTGEAKVTCLKTRMTYMHEHLQGGPTYSSQVKRDEELQLAESRRQNKLDKERRQLIAQQRKKQDAEAMAAKQIAEKQQAARIKTALKNHTNPTAVAFGECTGNVTTLGSEIFCGGKLISTYDDFESLILQESLSNSTDLERRQAENALRMLSSTIRYSSAVSPAAGEMYGEVIYELVSSIVE